MTIYAPPQLAQAAFFIDGKPVGHFQKTQREYQWLGLEENKERSECTATQRDHRKATTGHVKTTFFDGRFESYGVSLTGAVVSMTDRRGTTANYSYDHNRLIYIRYGTGSNVPYVSYAYAGQSLGTVTDGRSPPAISVSYGYDSQWRLATETEGAGVITYSYPTPAGNDLSSYRLDPPSGQSGITVTAAMSYDSVGRLSRIDWSPVSGGFIFAYNDDGQYAWGGGWGHYEIKLGGAKGQTPGKDSGLASGGGPGDQSYGAGFDVLGAP